MSDEDKNENPGAAAGRVVISTKLNASKITKLNFSTYHSWYGAVSAHLTSMGHQAFLKCTPETYDGLSDTVTAQVRAVFLETIEKDILNC